MELNILATNIKGQYSLTKVRDQYVMNACKLYRRMWERVEDRPFGKNILLLSKGDIVRQYHDSPMSTKEKCTTIQIWWCAYMKLFEFRRLMYFVDYSYCPMFTCLDPVRR